MSTDKLSELKAVADYWRKVKSGELPAPGPNEISITVCTLDGAVSRIAALLAELEASRLQCRGIEQERELFRLERTAHQLNAQALEQRIAELERITEGVDQLAIDGGWTARGMSEYAKSLEAKLIEMTTFRDNALNKSLRYWEELLELRSKLATPVRLPDTLAGIGEKLRTQDNRITSEPMFCVYQKREIVADAEYDHDRIVWVDEDGLEANERQRMRLELLHDNCREVPVKWRRVAVKEIDEFVTGCFTEQGCKDYLACNGHNLRLPFIYVKSGFRNAEYIALRNWLMTASFTVEGDEWP